MIDNRTVKKIIPAIRHRQDEDGSRATTSGKWEGGTGNVCRAMWLRSRMPS
jgi:hypothetical protein